MEGMETGESLSPSSAAGSSATSQGSEARSDGAVSSAHGERPDCRPLRRAMARAPMNHPSLHSMRSLWRL